MEKYDEVRRTTWRGAKVLKLRKFIKNFRKHIEGDLSSKLISELINEKSPLKKYAQITALKSIQQYIDEIFETKLDEKKEFKKRVFSGAKVVFILDYIDFQLIDLSEKIKQLQDDEKTSFLKKQNREEFSLFWKGQAEMLLKVKDWILYGFDVEIKSDSEIEFEDLDQLLVELKSIE